MRTYCKYCILPCIFRGSNKKRQLDRLLWYDVNYALHFIAAPLPTASHSSLTRKAGACT
jgi:hypothetical protein